jgi:hypothetical protein
MIQLVNILKTVISENILLNEQDDNSSKVDEYITNFLSDLIKIKNDDGFVYVTKDGQHIVILEGKDNFYIDKKFYGEFPDFVKYGFEKWINNFDLFMKLVVIPFPKESDNILNEFLKKRKYVNKFINLRFNDLVIYEMYGETNFVNTKEDKIAVMLIQDRAFINQEIYGQLNSVFNFDDIQTKIAFNNWFYDFYNYNVSVVNKILSVSGNATEMVKMGKKIGLVKDKINN